jgi:membrane peptidoglycan carboxypeptidase
VRPEARSDRGPHRTEHPGRRYIREPGHRSYYGQGGSPIGGKTGTTNDVTDEFNAALWFVGVTPHLASAAALVNPAAPGTPILDAPGHIGNASNTYGAVSAGIWSNALAGYLLGQPGWSWPSPDSVPGQVNVPFVLGKSPAEAISILQQAGFGVFQRKSDCGITTYPKGSVATTSPKRAVPGSTVMICLSSGQPPPPPTVTPTTPAASPPAAPPAVPPAGPPAVIPPGR